MRRVAAAPGLWGVLALTVLAGAARAEGLGACVWGKLSAAEQARVIAAYGRDMGAGAAALEKLDARVRTAAAGCSGRKTIPAAWPQTLAGSEGVQVHAASVLRIDRARLDAMWKAAPANVAACVRANGRLAFSPNALGCADPAATQWVLRQVGVARGTPAAAQAVFYFNAKAIGEWGDSFVAKLKP